MLKEEARIVYLAKRKLLATAEAEIMQKAMEFKLCSILNNYKIKTLAAYLPIIKQNEINAWQMALNYSLLKPEITLALPKINILNTMDFFTSHKTTSFAKNKWDILEPINETIINPKELEAIIIPLLCFNTNGFRVGYGKGFYDKYLTACNPNILKVGLSYFVPELNITDFNTLDIPLNLCITPEKVYEFK